MLGEINEPGVQSILIMSALKELTLTLFQLTHQR